MEEDLKSYTNGEITVTWESTLCTHSGRCVHGLPAVFDIERRPWINILGADSDAIRRQVRRCPSGALKCHENAEAD